MATIQFGFNVLLPCYGIPLPVFCWPCMVGRFRYLSHYAQNDVEFCSRPTAYMYLGVVRMKCRLLSDLQVVPKLIRCHPTAQSQPSFTTLLARMRCPKWPPAVGSQWAARPPLQRKSDLVALRQLALPGLDTTDGIACFGFRLAFQACISYAVASS